MKTAICRVALLTMFAVTSVYMFAVTSVYMFAVTSVYADTPWFDPNVSLEKLPPVNTQSGGWVEQAAMHVTRGAAGNTWNVGGYKLQFTVEDAAGKIVCSETASESTGIPGGANYTPFLFRVFYSKPPVVGGHPLIDAKQVPYKITAVIIPNSHDLQAPPQNTHVTQTFLFTGGGTTGCAQQARPLFPAKYDYRTTIDRTPRMETLPEGGTVARATIYLVNDGPTTGPKYKFSVRVTQTGGHEVCNSQSLAEWDPLPVNGLRTYYFKVTYPKPDVIVIGGKSVGGSSVATTQYTITAGMIPVERAGADTSPSNNSDTTSFTLNLGGTPLCSWSQ